jgi:hypothetical protein
MIRQRLIDKYFCLHEWVEKYKETETYTKGEKCEEKTYTETRVTLICSKCGKIRKTIKRSILYLYDQILSFYGRAGNKLGAS